MGNKKLHLLSPRGSFCRQTGVTNTKKRINLKLTPTEKKSQGEVLGGADLGPSPG